MSADVRKACVYGHRASRGKGSLRCTAHTTSPGGSCPCEETTDVRELCEGAGGWKSEGHSYCRFWMRMKDRTMLVGGAEV